MTTESTESLACRWTGCDKVCENAEVLYRHLCDDHVGRISKNNLCLTCSWDKCGASYGKRDHITSHIRIHTPLKPFSCAVCGKSFKRSQDLKKHGRTHGTVGPSTSVPVSKGADTPASPLNMDCNRSPAQTAEMLAPPELPDNMPTPTFSAGSSRGSKSPSSSPHNVAFDSLKRDKGNSADGRMPEPMYPSLPRYPMSPNYQPYPVASLPNETMSYPPLHSTLDAPYGPPVSESTKRPRSSVDDFWNDVRRKRLQPTYDPSMMDRLDSLLCPQVDQELSDLDLLLNESVNYINNTLPVDTRNLALPTPRSNLADMNAWLLQLGSNLSRQSRQEASSVPMDPAMPPGPALDFGQNLSQWGLSSIPGVEMVPDLTPAATESSWMMPQLAPMDRGLQPVYRQALPLTRAPPISSTRDEDMNDEDTDKVSEACVPSSSDSLRVLSPDASSRERHMNLVLNLLLALNQRVYVDPNTGHKLPISRQGSWASHRRSSGRLWSSSTWRSPPAPSPAPAMRSPSASREVRQGALPSIAQLLRDVNMN